LQDIGNKTEQFCTALF